MTASEANVTVTAEAIDFIHTNTVVAVCPYAVVNVRLTEITSESSVTGAPETTNFVHAPSIIIAVHSNAVVNIDFTELTSKLAVTRDEKSAKPRYRLSPLDVPGAISMSIAMLSIITSVSTRHPWGISSHS